MRIVLNYMDCVVKYLEEKEIIFTLSYILQSLVENLSSAQKQLLFSLRLIILTKVKKA